MMERLGIIAVLLAASLLCACGSETALSPSPSPSVSAEPSPSPTPSAEPSPSPTPSPSAESSPSPTPSPSAEPSPSPSPEPSPSAEPSPSPSAVVEDTADKTIDVALSGGTGRSSVETPATYFTKDGADYARIVWSSANYIYMIVDGVQYDPVNDGGNSAFEIPIQLDSDMAVTACTVAMSAPTEIEYTLRFDSGSIK